MPLEMWRKSARSGAAIAAVSGAYGRDIEACVQRIECDVIALRRRGARLIAFPESALGGYLYLPHPGEPTPLDPAPPALPAHAEAFERIARAAGDAVVCLGYTEAAPGGPYASAVCVSGDGVLGHQRKVHIPPGEVGVISAGDRFEAFDTPAGRVGMMLCYDKIFPESGRALADDGAETIVCLSAWAMCRVNPVRRIRHDREVAHFNAIDSVRAIENQVVWVSANQHGSFGRCRFPGQSKVVDPDGRVLATTGDRAGVAFARIDARAAVAAYRSEIDHLGDRMPASYLVSSAAQAAAVV